MNRTYSLAQLVALPYDPPRMVQLAADTGCAAAGIRLLPSAPGGVHYPLMDDPALLRETLARMAATGVKLLDLEVVRLGLAFELAHYLPFLEVGARLGAKHVLVMAVDGEEALLTEQFAGLCDAAAAHGLGCDLEFLPWGGAASLGAATRIVEAAGRANAGVLVDPIHFARSNSTLEQLERVPRAWLRYAQICDAAVPAPTTVEGLIHDARSARLLPGEGGLDLRALFARLPADLPVSIEVPNDVRARAMGYEAWAKSALAHARRVLEHPAPVALRT